MVFESRRETVVRMSTAKADMVSGVTNPSPEVEDKITEVISEFAQTFIENPKACLRSDYRRKKTKHRKKRCKKGKDCIKPHASGVGEDISSLHTELIETLSSVKSSEIGTILGEIADMLGRLPVLKDRKSVV